MVMKKFIVVAYDIEKDKKRREIAKLLQKCGKRVNRSVFECFLSETELERLKEKLSRRVKRGEDVVLYYPLCRACIERIDRFGAGPSLKEVVKVF